MTVLSKSHKEKEQKEGMSKEDGGKIDRKLSEVNSRAVSRGPNELMSKFKMAVGDVIDIGGQLL